MLFNTTTDGTDYSSVVSSSDTLTESSESFSQSVASLRTDYINPDSGNSTQQPHGMKTRTVLVYPNRSHSDSDSPGIVSPSTVWVPPSTDDSTSHTDVDTVMVTVLEMSSGPSNIVMQTIYPENTATQEYTSVEGTEATATVPTPTWLTLTTEVPSSETVVYYTRDFIFTDTSTTFTKGLPTLTVIPTEATFTTPTGPVVTDTSFYERWLSGALDSNSTSSGSNKDTIIGGVIGSVGGLALMILVIYLLFRKRRRRNLIEHEKSFSHDIGRKMGYDDIGTFIAQSQQTTKTTTRVSTTAHNNNKVSKSLPSVPPYVADSVRRPQTTNPFDDEYVVSIADPESQTPSTTSLHSSFVSSSTDEGTHDTEMSVTYDENPQNAHGYLTELIEH